MTKLLEHVLLGANLIAFKIGAVMLP